MPSSDDAAQDVQVWVTSVTRTRLNKMKPDFTFSNKTELVNFLIDLFELVKPLIIHGEALQDVVKEQIVRKLQEKKKFLKKIDF